MNTIIYLVVVVIVVGVVLYLMNLVPMDATLKRIVQVIVIAGLVIWLLVKFIAPLLSGVHP